jgi:hypothetical protein
MSTISYPISAEKTPQQKAVMTRNRNYAKTLTAADLQELREALPDVSQEELMRDLKFYVYLVA